MIKDLNKSEMLELLMTSDFSDGYTPDEFKYLLDNYRYFYRELSSKMEQLNHRIDEINTLNKVEVSLLRDSIFKLQCENSNIINTINSLKTRNLSFSERISGKIKFTD